ncbi:putative sugar nucleotidyl transferase [Candidatus Latescibacterota bacterium]
MKIILFEDNQCERLYPIGLFRPLYRLRVGSWTLESMIELLDIPALKIVREHFLFNDAKNNVISQDNEPLLFLNASIEPDVNYLDTIKDIIQSGESFVTTSGNRVAAAYVSPDISLPDTVSVGDIGPQLLDLNLKIERNMFRTIDWPHEVISSHLRLFRANLDKIISTGNYSEQQPGFFVGENVELSPSTVIDTSQGPVVIDSGVTVKHFTCLNGPIHIGENSVIIEYSSIKDSTSIGRRCKIGGEVEGCIISCNSNKQHHGFLGHSWVGQWVNIGAGTSSSDLKNTYGKVRVDYGGKRMETDMQFLGSIIGDFAKTAVNTSLFTGKIIGVSSMIYGTVTSNVPSFSNFARSFGQVTEISLDQIIKTQKRMFERRDVKQTDSDIALMKRVFKMTRHERTMSEEQINF